MTTGGQLLILPGCMRWGKLHDYAYENSCLTFGSDTLTTNPYNPSATPDVLGIIITKDLPSPVHLILCSALISDHLPLIIDTICCSCFLHPPHHPDFKHTDWASFQACLEDDIPIKPDLHNRVAIDTCVENLFSAIMKVLAASIPKSHPHDDPQSPIPSSIQDEICLKNWLWRQQQVTRDCALRAEINRLQMSVICQLNVWRNDWWSATTESLELILAQEISSTKSCL